MTGRSLIFTTDTGSLPDPNQRVDAVIVDPWWVADPALRPDLVAVRDVVADVLANHDVVEESLGLLDRWAEEMRLPELLTVDGASWWFRIRMAVRWDIQEQVLWLLVLRVLVDGRSHDRIEVPASVPNLVAAAQAFSRTPGAPAVRVAGRPSTVRAAMTPGSIVRTRVPYRVRQAARLVRGLAPSARRRRAVLDERLRRLSAEPGATLVLAWSGAFQVVDDGRGRRLMDPHTGLVADHLGATGTATLSIDAGLDHLRAADWSRIIADEGVLPQAYIRERFSRAIDGSIDDEGLARRLRSTPTSSIPAAGCDLGPAMHRVVADHAGSWLADQRRWVAWAERFLGQVRPSAILLDREGTRTPWLVAARRVGVPTVAVQHGMIYRGNPEYFQAGCAAAPVPDVTCVFGEAERRLLHGTTREAASRLVVTGSPRHAAAGGADRSGTDRSKVRAELGIADGDRMLVVSLAHGRMGELTDAAFMATLLGGELPGVHVVLKLHPQDRAPSGHARMLGRLATPGAPPPKVSVIRDFDLVRLLRAADAHLGQYSTVLTDAVRVGTPNMVAVGLAHVDPLRHAAAGVATAVQTRADVLTFMRDPRPAAPEARGRFLAAHFEAGDAVARIAEVVRSAPWPPEEERWSA